MRNNFTFYLGVHVPAFMERTSVPLCISRRRLQNRETFPQAKGDWILDSGAFTELMMHGRWRMTPFVYAMLVRRAMESTGNMRWAASMDYMCEPFILAKTKKTVVQHQQMTIDNYIEIKTEDAALPIAPVIQGWTIKDYLRHVEMYGNQGINLQTLPTVGVGSVCKRQGTDEVFEILSALKEKGLHNLHGFGIKQQGIHKCKTLLQSSDSMAWSFNARHERTKSNCRLPNCANCLHYALDWRKKILRGI